MSMETLFSSWVIINRPIMEVFQYMAHPPNFLEWVPFYSKVEVLAENDGHATRFRGTLDLRPLPWSPTIDVDVVDYVPGRRLAWRLSAIGGAATCEFEPSSKGTIVTVTLSLWSWQALVLGYFAAPARPFVNDLIAQVFLSLKRRAEARTAEVAPLVFFSYRRSTAKYIGGRIYDALCQEFGAGSVFRDMDSIPGGSQWLLGIHEALKHCRVVVAHIGDGWEDEIKLRAERGEQDVLREELETALADERTTLIPVFTSTQEEKIGERLRHVIATLPKGAIKVGLEERQGVMLRSDPDFRQDLEKVIQTIWAELRRFRSARVHQVADQSYDDRRAVLRR